jgi:hypothetical protein
MAPARPNRALFAIPRALTRVEVPGLVQRAAIALVVTGAGRLVCDARRASPNAVTVDALARVGLAARRAGAVLELRASAELCALLELCGLGDVLR